MSKPNSGPSVGVLGRWGFSALTSMIWQAVTYGLNLLAGNSSSSAIPKPIFQLDPSYVDLTVSLIGKVSSGLASWSGMPQIVEFIAGWVAIGGVVFWFFMVLGKLFKYAVAAIITVVVIAGLIFIHFIPNFFPT